MGIFESTMEDKANTAANSHPSESPPILRSFTSTWRPTNRETYPKWATLLLFYTPSANLHNTYDRAVYDYVSSSQLTSACVQKRRTEPLLQ